MGPITSRIHTEFFGMVNGLIPDRFGWLTPVQVGQMDMAGETVNA